MRTEFEMLTSALPPKTDIYKERIGADEQIAPSSQRVSLSDSGVGLTTSATKCSGSAVACVRGRRRLTESEYESVRSLSTDS
ncbi:unnamed protein product [Phytophthora fragariaefolia]|uniref:Unnamed protein product n=1 Tax=Phytophthora fragariaefolia TaxID=1490495 RepID=A0A9W6YJZ7_9STRA|nr:unnamed protein product [Phytophthora fragariaefolia]